MKTDVNLLKEKDIYSILLFALFNLKDIPEYSTLSELSYILDKNSLLRLCEYYGGMTIKIPTVFELETMLHALMMYQLTHIDGKTLPVAIKRVQDKTPNIRKVKQNYYLLCNILDNYTFNGE